MDHGRVVQNRAVLELPGHAVPGVVQLFQPEHIAASDHTQQIRIRQTQHLIRGKQASPSLAFCLAILGDHLCNGHRLPYGHGGLDRDTHISAAGRKILGCHTVGAAEHELNIAVADDFGPEIVGISVLELSKALNGQHDPDISGTDHAQCARKVRAVGSAADATDVVKLIQDEIDRYIAGTSRTAVSVSCQLDEEEREEQGRQESHAGVLIA